MVSLGIWLVIMLACFGAGAGALRLLRARCDGSAEEIAFSTALGMGILAYLVLAIGLLGQLKVWLAAAVVVALAVVGHRQIGRLVREAAAGVGRVRTWAWSAVLPLLFFLAAAVLTLIGALAPSAGADYDGLVYHLTMPKLYLARGEIYPIPWLSHSNFPFTLEMLYLLGLLLKGQALAKLFHFGCGWLTVCAIFAFGRRWWDRRSAWLGGAIFAAIPLVAWQMMSAYNELAFALYTFLAIYALARWVEGRQEERGGAWLWGAAIMCGLALATKMLAAALFLFMLGATVWYLGRARARRAAVVQIVTFCLVTVAVCSPWYVKSYLWTGNPVYPFAYEIFDGKYWTEGRAEAYTDAQKEFGLAGGPVGFIALPWNLTMRPRWFFDQPGQLRAFTVFITVFGPLLLALVPVLVVAGPVGRAGRLLLGFALCYTVIWFSLSQNGRYLAPILPGLSACAGLGAGRLLQGRRAAAPAVRVALLLGLSLGLYPAFMLAAPAVKVALGAESRASYLKRTWASYSMFESINRATPSGARILVLGDEPRLFYLERDYLFGDHAEIFSAEDLTDSEAFLSTLTRMGVTHLLLPSDLPNSAGASYGKIESQVARLAREKRLRIVLQDSRWSLALWEVANERNERRG